MSVDRNAFLNAVGGFLAGCGEVGLCCFFALLVYWSNTAPSIADPSLGYVFQHNNHGSITYFNAFQRTSCALLPFISILLFILGFATVPKKNVTYKSGQLSFSAKYELDDPRGWNRVGKICGAIFALLFIFLIGPCFVTWLNSFDF